MSLSSPAEVELKYRVTDTAALVRLLDTEPLGGLHAGPWRTVEMEDRYLETADARLAAGGYAARLRRTLGGTVISLKGLHDGHTTALGSGTSAGAAAAPSPSRALHRRAEVEGPATGDLAPDEWPDSAARRLLLQLSGGAQLHERFTVRQRRRERELRGAGGWALLSLDEIEVHRQGRVLGRVPGLEIELRRGSEELLTQIAARLEASGLVEPEPRSKMEIAQTLVDELDPVEGAPLAAEAAATLEGALARLAPTDAADQDREAPAQGVGAPLPLPEPPSLAKPERTLKAPKSPGVSADDRLSEAGRKVLRFHLARMLAAEEGARSGQDGEHVHDMRVATRRMRAAWRVFEGSYRRKAARRYVAELRDVARALGAVRDLDVLLDGIEEYRGSLPDAARESLEPLVADWRGRRDEARTAMVRMLDSDDYRRFVDDYLEFVHSEGAGAVPLVPNTPYLVRDTAGSRIWEAYERVRARDGALAWADVTTLHELRIEGKRLRYTLEFFREALGPEAGSLIGQVTRLQDHLGALHDADVTARLARDFLVDPNVRRSRETTAAVGRYLTAREREVGRLRRSFAPLWRSLMGTEFRRDLARAVSAL